MRLIRRLIAEDWFVKAYLAAAVCLAWWVTFTIATPTMSDLRHIFQAVIVLLLFAVAAVVGFGVAMVLSPFFVVPVYEIHTRLNGGPFAPGDHVCILSGPYAGRVSHVYQQWQHTSVRVELGDEAREAFQDVFGQHQLRRVKEQAEESPAPN